MSPSDRPGDSSPGAPARERFSFELRDSGFPAIDRLLRTPAFDERDWEARFAAAMDEAYAHHRASSSDYRGHVAQAAGAPDRVRSLADVERIPWLFVSTFKEADLVSGPRERIVRTITSSGTGGLKTKLFLDETSLNRFCASAYAVYRGLGIADERARPCNYLLFTYDIAHAPDVGTAWSDVLISEMVPGHEKVFLLRRNEAGDFSFDLDFALATYARFQASGLPLRILGFPAFVHRLTSELVARGLPPLAPTARADSWLLTGGGWKNHAGTVIPKAQFAGDVEQAIGLPKANVRDLFGMAEHGVGYVDCEHGRLHVPIYAHAVTRDPFTLAKLPAGAPGLLHLYTPLLSSYPSLSLLTTDEVTLDETPCRCGRRGAGLVYGRRVGISKYDGCAIRALEYLK